MPTKFNADKVEKGQTPAGERAFQRTYFSLQQQFHLRRRIDGLFHSYRILLILAWLVLKHLLRHILSNTHTHTHAKTYLFLTIFLRQKTDFFLFGTYSVVSNSSPLHQLNFRKFSTQDILIPTYFIPTNIQELVPRTKNCKEIFIMIIYYYWQLFYCRQTFQLCNASIKQQGSISS